MECALVFRLLVCGAALFFHTLVMAKSVTIDMLNGSGADAMVFKPAVIKIEVGETVVFKSIDPGHQVTFIDGPTGYGGPWQSELSSDFVVTPSIPGTYSYICAPHLLMGMIGILQVGPDVNIHGPEKAFAARKKHIQLNKERVESYIKELKDLR